MIKIENTYVYDLYESIKASKYPKAIDTEKVNEMVTPTVKTLAQSPKGEGHDQFLTGIRVAFDLTCSNKMWVEAERYRFFEFVSSQSTMHCVDRFDIENQCNEYVTAATIEEVERLKRIFKNDPTTENKLTLLYNIPSGFQLTARITTNYRCLKTIYSQRKTHLLLEWREFCDWIKCLPHSELITGGKNDD